MKITGIDNNQQKIMINLQRNSNQHKIMLHFTREEHQIRAGVN
jgi:hypothetical protein